MKTSTICPCCSSLLPYHFGDRREYWFCRHCWQEIPSFECDRHTNDKAEANVIDLSEKLPIPKQMMLASSNKVILIKRKRNKIMSNTILKTQANICGDRKNILNSRLSEKLENLADRKKEHQNIFDRLSKFEQQQLLKNLKSDYSLILFDYFSSKDTIEQKIEDFAKEAFNISLPMNKIVEIHLDIIDSLEHHSKSDYQSMCKIELEKRKKLNAKNSLFSQSF